MASFCISFFFVDYLSSAEKLQDAALNQQSYSLKVCDLRGTIYDCKNVALVNNKSKLMVAAIPCTETLTALTPIVPENKQKELYEKCSKNTPFTIEVTKNIKCPYIKTFEVPVRYSGANLAAHIIGYLSAEKKGICGIEKAYNDYLSGDNHSITVSYSVDACGKILPGKKEFTNDKSYLKSKGVILNIDSRIQTIAEETANKYITRGAVIVSQVPNCEIRACTSFPSFSHRNIGVCLKNKNSPLLNRALCSFNLGSIFKLVTCAAALENGIKETTLYDCKGITKVEDASFRCFNSKKHEVINMEQALAYSCNGYFIDLIQKMPKNALLNMAKKFRLGSETQLAPGIISHAGILPSEESLENIKTLANFSFGQGKLMATPMQIAGLVNTIASGGVYSKPKLIKGLAAENMKLIKDDNIKEETEKIISEKNANILKNHMKASIDYGTSKKGKPDGIECAAKTSTAQTGIIENGKKIEQSWFAGFFPFEKPKYCVVVLAEAGTGGAESCGPVFKEIAEKMVTDIPELFIDS